MIDAGACVLRPWRIDDLDALIALASEEAVSRYLADRFPYPYLRADGESWLAAQAQAVVDDNFAIDVDGMLAGGIGLDPHSGERRHVSLIGYWLGEPFWGRGLATAACRALTEYAFEERGFVRLEASVYAPNVASMRVLEKCEYVREGVMRKAIIKRGEILDAYLYAKTNE